MAILAVICGFNDIILWTADSCRFGGDTVTTNVGQGYASSTIHDANETTAKKILLLVSFITSDKAANITSDKEIWRISKTTEDANVQNLQSIKQSVTLKPDKLGFVQGLVYF